jgi:23S rRNA (guanosine2251-2'-O)-methyltransferase
MDARLPSGCQVRKCQVETCGLRYPCQDDYTFKERCPRCGGPTRLVLPEKSGFGEADSAVSLKRRSEAGALSLKRRPLVRLQAMLDNVRSAWNVGSIFRSADGAGFDHVYLCGITPTPEYPAVLKTSLGAEKSLPWAQHLDGFLAAQALVQAGLRLWALENDPSACNLYDVTDLAASAQAERAIVLVVGNEVAGVDADILALCEQVLYLPMHGIKRSYNVAVAFGIAAHYLGWLADPPAT